ncbi:hypothetical protein VDGD_09973 [Verticillium dahliae]|nr:hypothetical protein VDGD_09973 [Verticillium dahliae]
MLPELTSQPPKSSSTPTTTPSTAASPPPSPPSTQPPRPPTPRTRPTSPSTACPSPTQPPTPASSTTTTTRRPSPAVLVQVTGRLYYGRGREAAAKTFNEVFVLVPNWDTFGRNAPKGARRWLISSQNFRSL